MTKPHSKLLHQIRARPRIFIAAAVGIAVFALLPEIFYPAAREAQVDHSVMDEADVEDDTAKGLMRFISAIADEDGHMDARVES